MSKKISDKVDFRVLSGKFCECGRPLKANLVNRKTGPVVCYVCFRANSKRTIQTARDIRRDPSLRSVKRMALPLRGA